VVDVDASFGQQLFTSQYDCTVTQVQRTATMIMIALGGNRNRPSRPRGRDLGMVVTHQAALSKPVIRKCISLP
jgi:hypothetical protein